ncbi:hypothetical protein L9F63_007600 [Diploptera punctata]|uniref:Odorant receptor n=1 Tax=Diploptera punctata TaxID=6984 RepID=A0AAD8E357_DIPPU|nr:hypothetical protein L9F63_007600 [Diploptera punctata]
MEPSVSDIYLSKQLWIARTIGYWPYPKEAALWKKILSITLYYFTLIIKLVTLTAVVGHIYMEWGHLPDPVDTITILTSHVNSLFSMIYIPIKIKKLQHLVTLIDNLFILPDKNSAEIYNKTYNKYKNSASLIGNLFIASGFFTGLLSYISPIISEKVDGKRPLPYDAAFPFDVSSGMRYWGVYLLLATSFMTMAMNGTFSCELFVSLTIKTTCQFNFLQLKILDIKKDIIKMGFNIQKEKSTETKLLSELSFQDIKITDVHQNIYLKKSEEQMHEAESKEMINKLNECIKYHQALLE